MQRQVPPFRTVSKSSTNFQLRHESAILFFPPLFPRRTMFFLSTLSLSLSLVLSRVLSSSGGERPRVGDNERETFIRSVASRTFLVSRILFPGCLVSRADTSSLVYANFSRASRVSEVHSRVPNTSCKVRTIGWIARSVRQLRARQEG